MSYQSRQVKPCHPVRDSQTAAFLLPTIMPGLTYGENLPDQVDRISSSFDAHLQLLAEVRDLYRDRAALEREYATKLQAMTKRAAEKRARLVSAFVLGDEPTKTWSESVLAKNTLNAAFNQLIASMSNTAQDHVNLADALTMQVVDVLKADERKREELKKKEVSFFQRLLAERDRAYADRLKAKQKYDEECSEVESVRQKQVRATDDRHADRAAKQAEQQRVDMLNGKNVYILSTAIANSVKSKFYNTDLPTLENQLQIIQSRLVAKFVKVLTHSLALQTSHVDVLKGRLGGVEAALGQVNPSQDQDIFIEYNIRPFNPPNDWVFEPCVNHYDTDAISLEPAPKVFLQNKLARSRGKLQELGPLMDGKRREQDQLWELFHAYDADHSLGKTEEVDEKYLDANHQVISYATSECILKTEIDVISAAVGDDEGGQHPHSFKSSSFSIPTQCGYCKSSIWGLSKQGKTCKACNLSVHSKCELKVPANCKQTEQGPKAGGLSRSSTSASRMEPAAPPTASAFAQSVAEESYEESYPTARLLFDFAPTSEFELRVSEGAAVQVLEPDDGSGWVKVSDGESSGLVPASYLEYGSEDGTPAPSAGPSSEEGSGQYVRGVYAYEAQGADELGLDEGELVELTSGPNGGQHYGDGWWEGINSTGQKGIFPSNYVEMA
ncbi:hypothetical protein FB45DRAFT_284926 [Roridomyces roridus]|uniref:Uncharacterized protein n=1 Tax=Roridomyces roridus TaxID=1738132 RepID=A0AAD7CAL6_9AGAR|nr:hypothetical protein FB45DRAFT_284926 [Roridomyces roridus]